jgi:hypothetical protein
MTRLRYALVLVLIGLFACSGKRPIPDVFAESMAGFHRTSQGEAPVSAPPDPIPAKEIDQIRAATYDGPGKLQVRVYALANSAVALDVVQRWKPAPDTVFFYSDRFVVVIRWESADRKALQGFVGELEKRFQEAK